MLVSKIMKTSKGTKTMDDSDAVCIPVLCCSTPRSVALLRTMAANIVAYRMTTIAKQTRIHDGINTIIQDQLSRLSSFMAISVICKMLIAAKNSNSMPLLFLTDHTHTDIERSDINKRGTKARLHVCLRVSNLSHIKISDISRSNCKDKDMSMDLKWI